MNSISANSMLFVIIYTLGRCWPDLENCYFSHPLKPEKLLVFSPQFKVAVRGRTPLKTSKVVVCITEDSTIEYGVHVLAVTRDATAKV